MHEKIKEIVLSREAITAIAQEAADMVKRQLLLDDQIKIDPDQLNKLADKISTRMDVAVDYDRIKNAHLSEIRKVEDKFKNYELTDQDRVDIAEKALLELDLSDEIRDTLARSFVSKSFFNEKIGILRQFVRENKGRAATAGISGKEMIEEINKVLGTDWQTGAEGDMLKSIYDSNDDGKVNAADAADSVPWEGVTDKPAFGDVSGPASSNDEEVAVFDSTTGKFLKTVPVTIDPVSRKMAGLGATEQDDNAYMKQNFGLWWTDDGLASGNFRFNIEPNNLGVLLLIGIEGNRVNISSTQFRIIMPTADTALYVIGGITTENNLNVQGDVKFKIYMNSVSNPPTLIELNSIFGTPATVGAGFAAYINDNGAGNNVYLVIADGANWHIFTATKAV